MKTPKLQENTEEDTIQIIWMRSPEQQKTNKNHEHGTQKMKVSSENENITRNPITSDTNSGKKHSSLKELEDIKRINIANGEELTPDQEDHPHVRKCIFDRNKSKQLGNNFKPIQYVDDIITVFKNKSNEISSESNGGDTLWNNPKKNMGDSDFKKFTYSTAENQLRSSIQRSPETNSGISKRSGEKPRHPDASLNISSDILMIIHALFSTKINHKSTSTIFNPINESIGGFRGFTYHLTLRQLIKKGDG